MNTPILIGAGIGLSTFSFLFGAKCQQRAIKKKFMAMTPLLAKAMLDSVEMSFQPGATPDAVIDQLEESLAFIEQVL